MLAVFRRTVAAAARPLEQLVQQAAAAAAAAVSTSGFDLYHSSGGRLSTHEEHASGSLSEASGGICSSRHTRPFSTSRSASDLRDFLDTPDPQNAAHGRAWEAVELENKSWDDLHKLWYVCLKERNMLLTQMSWAQASEKREKQPNALLPDYYSRYKKVKLTMNRIKQVLSQRALREPNPAKALAMKRVIHYS